MRFELTDEEWTAIKPMLLNKPRGVPPLNDRRVRQAVGGRDRFGSRWANTRLMHYNK
jgi:transposase